MSDDVRLRPLTAADVPAAQLSSFAALTEAGTRYGFAMPTLDEAGQERAQLRFRHLLRTDPDGCWVLEDGGDIVGVGLATRRGPLWFLSLLTVSPQVQGKGLGGRLLAATLRTAQDADAGLIMASNDPKALRRYALAGFDLLPGYRATGVLDRSLLPEVHGVREGSFDDDRDLVDDLAQALRGAPYGPDLDAYRDAGRRLVVTDTAEGRGFAVLHETGVTVLGAGNERAATRLLWFALGEAAPGAPLELGPLTADQQWALRVALQSRLSVAPGDSLCVRGAVGPLTPYLAGGAYG